MKTATALTNVCRLCADTIPRPGLCTDCWSELDAERAAQTPAKVRAVMETTLHDACAQIEAATWMWRELFFVVEDDVRDCFCALLVGGARCPVCRADAALEGFEEVCPLDLRRLLRAEFSVPEGKR